MGKALELGVCVPAPDIGSVQPLTEMQLLEILAAVYDQRASGATSRIQAEIDAAQARLIQLEHKCEQLEQEREMLEESRRIRVAWAEIKPHIVDTNWYKAALAVAELDDALY